MAKTEEKQTTTPKKNHYKNPTETWWGKAVVWVLFFGMVGLILVGFILSIINGNA
jgi:cytochrome b561